MEVSELLQAWSSGDRKALDRLVPLVYDELRRLAQRMRHILVDIARSRASGKRGGKVEKVSIAEAVNLTSRPLHGVLELDDALTAPVVVRVRFFARNSAL